MNPPAEATPAPPPKMWRRWLIVTAIPLLSLVWFWVAPPANATEHLVNGIILITEAVFLFKFVLFGAIVHHLRHEYAYRNRNAWLLLPLLLLGACILRYFALI